MSETERPADETKPDAADVQAVIDFSRQFNEVRLSHLASVSTLLERQLRVNEAAAAFYEKVILFDAATVVLSLSFLASLTAHMPGGHVPRHPFLWFLCPSWVLLLISIYCCSMRIANYHNTNFSLVGQMSGLSSTVYCQHFGILVNRLSTLLKGGYSVGKDGLEARAFFSKVSATLMNAATDESNKMADLLKAATEADKRTSYLALLGTTTTTLAITLICIFAVKTIVAI